MPSWKMDQALSHVSVEKGPEMKPVNMVYLYITGTHHQTGEVSLAAANLLLVRPQSVVPRINRAVLSA